VTSDFQFEKSAGTVKILENFSRWEFQGQCAELQPGYD